MHTPWGDLRVTDAHVHFFSHRFFSLLAAQQEGLTVEQIGLTLGWDMPSPDPGSLGAQWVAVLDTKGVSRAALIASLPGDEGSVATAVRENPNRFWGYFILNPVAGDAVDRVRSAFEQGLRGVCLFPAMHRYPVGDDRVSAVLDLVSSTPGAVVFVHCGVLTVGVRKKLGMPSPFDMRFSNPIDLHPVALRYPGCKFVVPHFGGGFFREALMLCDLCPNVHLDTSSSNGWMKYQPERLDLRTVFQRALEVAGPSRLLFGTDSSFFPRGWNRGIFDEQIDALESLGVSEEAARQIFGENQERLLS